ncbi:hypothetical protein [Caulobacter endophyticus]|uniref:Uncharacterized protein n=1 Tax=Caulobacter endophyticus TaxID=2172652 RepID=A0A2T9JJB2_9CAUL|nr:hypothetical protein [Caulobacter endophyticus]PVM83772.1 hypothetical protein DDF67_20080 [Caulobacter endophyticus]
MTPIKIAVLALLAGSAACGTAVAAETCSADQIRYAREAGTPCSALRPVEASTAALLARTTSLYASPAAGPVGVMRPHSAWSPASAGSLMAIDDDVLPPQNMEGPGVAYVLRAGPPKLNDMSSGTAMIAMVNGGVLGVSVAHLIGVSHGRDVVRNYGIDDSSGAMARKIAVSFAAANNGHLVRQALPQRPDGRSLSSGGPQVGSAAYVVEIEPTMYMQRFYLAPSRVDLAYRAKARVFDASSGEVVAKAKCKVNAYNTPDDVSRTALLANGAEGLKALIASRSEICLEQLKTKLAI